MVVFFFFFLRDAFHFSSEILAESVQQHRANVTGELESEYEQALLCLTAGTEMQ